MAEYFKKKLDMKNLIQILLLTLLSLISGIKGKVDLTVVPKSAGNDVITACDSKIRDSNIFTEDNGFLKRMAFVASNNGLNPATYSSISSGGIWKVSDSVFMASKRKNTPSMIDINQKILKQFNINWSETTYADLDKPFYSALAIKLYLASVDETLPSSIRTQAIFWKDNFELNGSEETFEEEVRNLERGNYCSVKLDLVIALDASSSVMEDNFATAKNFIVDVISQFDLTSARVGFLTYGDDAEIILPLRDNRRLSSMTRAIKSATYSSGGTLTNLAIDSAITMFNTSESNSRVLIVMTDGRSSHPLLTKESSIRAKDIGITTFSIGIGSLTSLPELIDIAGGEISRVIEVSSFDALKEITHRVNDAICSVSYVLTKNTPVAETIYQNETKYYTYTRVCSDADVKVNLKSGKILGYYSYSFPNPSSAIHDGVIEDGIIFVPNSSNGRSCSENDPKAFNPLYITVIGVENSNEFNIRIDVKNITVHTEGTDLTLKARTSGHDVVEAVNLKIRDSKIFTDDHGFLRRLAFALSNDGLNPETYTTTPSGGIWKVTKETFTGSKNNSPKMVAIKKNIRQHFGIDWDATTYEDLEQPLYSALAIKLLEASLNENVPDTIQSQANFLKNKFNSKASVDAFVKQVKKLEQGSKCSRQMDLVFALDGSDNMGTSNFYRVKQFIVSLLSKFDLSSVSIGFITYSNSSTTVISLNSTEDLTILSRRIKNASYSGGKAKTNLVLDSAISMFRLSSSANVPRILIVITDAQSDNPAQTKASSIKATENGITTFSIGVGNSASRPELIAIAGGESSRVIQVSSTSQALREATHRVSEAICSVPHTILVNIPVENTVMQNETKFYQYNFGNLRDKLKIDFKSGRFLGYYSSSFPKPSSAIHEGIFHKGLIFFPEPNEENDANSTVYVTVTGVDNSSNEISIVAERKLTPDDGIETPKTSGYDVVEAVNRKIRDSRKFTEDNDLLTRMALVATNFGQNSTTYTNVSGGIWKVPNSIFVDTIRKKSRKLVAIRNEVLQHFNIDWRDTIYTDLDKPLYSALATKIYLESIDEIVLDTVEAQASLIKNILHVPEPENIIAEKINRFEQEQYHPQELDLVIVLDGSSGMGKDNFNLAKRLIEETISKYELPSVRIGFIIYSTEPKVIIPLNSGKNLRTIIRDIKNSVHPGGEANTDLAIDAATSMLSPLSRVSRAILVMTDGYSDSPSLTAVSSEKAKTNGIQTFAIGIGSFSNPTELLTITGDEPNRVLEVPDLDHPTEMANKVNKAIFFTSYPLLTNTRVTDKINPNQTKYYKYSRNCSETSLKLDLKSGTGSIIGYYSYSEPNPSFANNDGLFKDGVSLIPQPEIGNPCSSENDVNSTSMLYLTVKGVGDSIEYTFDLNPDESSITEETEVVDLTLEPRTSGHDVVEAVNLKIRDSKLFTDDHGFLRRMAFVLSNDGINPETYTETPYGGIWKVTKEKFTGSKNNSPHMVTLKKNIRQHFGIDWDATTNEDLEKPLYSALAIKLLQASLIENVPDTIQGQANFWKNKFNSKGSVETFLRQVNKLEQGSNCSRQMDLVFALDGSSSIGSGNFFRVKDFIVDLISKFDLSSVRIGFITFSDRETTVISLNSTLDFTIMSELIKNAVYSGGDANTNLAIDSAISMFNLSSSTKFPRILVVITDGLSDNPAQTKVSSIKAIENGITTFSIGIGLLSSRPELIAIAGGESSRVIQVSSSQALKDATHRVSEAICSVSHLLNSLVTDTLRQNQTKFYQYNFDNRNEKFTIDLKSGRFVGYYSSSFPNPSSAIHDGTFEKRRIFFPEPNENEIISQGNSTIYVTLTGVDDSNDISFDMGEVIQNDETQGSDQHPDDSNDFTTSHIASNDIPASSIASNDIPASSIASNDIPASSIASHRLLEQLVAENRHLSKVSVELNNKIESYLASNDSLSSALGKINNLENTLNALDTEVEFLNENVTGTISDQGNQMDELNKYLGSLNGKTSLLHEDGLTSTSLTNTVIREIEGMDNKVTSLVTKLGSIDEDLNNRDSHSFSSLINKLEKIDGIDKKLTELKICSTERCSASTEGSFNDTETIIAKIDRIDKVMERLNSTERQSHSCKNNLAAINGLKNDIQYLTSVPNSIESTLKLHANKSAEQLLNIIPNYTTQYPLLQAAIWKSIHSKAVCT